MKTYKLMLDGDAVEKIVRAYVEETYGPVVYMAHNVELYDCGDSCDYAGMKVEWTEDKTDA